MKKILLALAAVAVAASSTNAQRITLWEEFTGENCPPCAGTNPGLWDMYKANTTKSMLIKYQVPIPSAGPIYNEYTTDAAARRTYYSANSAPNMWIDGKVCCVNSSTQAPSAHPAYLAQGDVDNFAGVASPFVITVTGKYNQANDSLIATIKVKATTAYSASTANLKLRVGFAQTLIFATAPGTNGEKEFEHVVRKMLPTASGTTVPNTWTANQEQIFTVAAPKQAHIKSKDGGFFVAWIQNDAAGANAKEILQAGYSSENIFPTNIEETAAVVSDASVYPNPAINYATVVVNVKSKVIGSVNVTDISGRTVHTIPALEFEKGTNKFGISTENFANGMYQVTINTSEGSTSQRFSIAK